MPARSFVAVLSLFLLAACHGESSPSSEKHTSENGGGGSPFPPISSLTEGMWLKGDLHLHSHHSADGTSPLSSLIADAESAGMGYFMTTDHDNHVNGDVASHTWADPDYRSDSMVMLYGAEWTTHRGHGNTIAAAPYDHQSFYDLRDELDTRIGARASELGFHFSACHPASGDAWDFSYDMVDGLEIWNSVIWTTNSGAVVIWDDLLKSGRRLTGRGGSDSHHNLAADPSVWNPNTLQGPINYVGTPTTWVFARERSAEAVVSGLDSGRVSVSANPNSERIEFFADTNRDGEMDMMMGDVAEASGEPVNFQVDIVAGSGLGTASLYYVTVVKDGAEFGTFPVVGATLKFSDTPALGVRSYYRVEVQGLPTAYPQAPLAAAPSIDMIGLSNPIYFNFLPKS